MIFHAVRNKYNGMYIAAQSLPDCVDVFVENLQHALSAWAEQGVQLVWIKLAAEQAAYISASLAQGFEFHHCQAREVMLVRRLCANAYVPLASTHTVGVGAVVLAPDRRILVVLESRDVAARPGYYKLPGGMLERHEHLADGVVREVREETGILTSFRGLLSFRHHHQGQFGASNLYAVCMLEPLTYDICIDTNEIGDARWIPVDDYLASPDIGLYIRRVVQAALYAQPLACVKIDGYMNAPEDYEIYLPER